MSLFSQEQNNGNIIPTTSQKTQEGNSKPYHPIEFYSLGKVDPNLLNNNNLLTNNNYSKDKNNKNATLNYNYSSHELFNRNILSVNNPYFEKYKEVKPKIVSNPSLDKNENENNYLEPLNTINIRNKINYENQKRNNINSLEWFHLIKNRVYIIDQNSRIKKGNNITRNKFYQEKGNKQVNNNDNNNSLKGIDFNNENNNNINKINNIFNIKRFKQGNDYLLNKKDIFVKEKEIKQIENGNNYWKKLRIEQNLEGNNTIDNTEIKKNISEKKLKSNFFYFDKNHTNIIRHKNWWKIDP